MTEKVFSAEVHYSWEVGEITKTPKYWQYLIVETTPFATHTYHYHSTNLKTLTAHRDDIVEKYNKRMAALNAESCWNSVEVKPTYLDQLTAKPGERIRG